MNPLGMRRTVALAGLFGLIAAPWGGQTALATRNLKAGDPMPAFSLPRADGVAGEYDSSELKGQLAAIIFWRPKQKLSLEALRDVSALAGELGDAKVRIVAVDASRSSSEEARAALAGEKFSFPIVRDPRRELYGKVGVIVSPTTLLVDAEGVLRFVVASRPRQFRQIVRARLRFLLGQTDEAQMKQEIEPTILQIDHELAAAWRMYNLGRRLQTEGKSQQAVVAYEKAVSEHPSLPEARCALGFMKLSAGDFAAAGQHFQTALVHHPNSAMARLGKAAVQAQTGKQQAAEQALLSLLGNKSIAVRVRYELGRIYHGRGELDKAVTYYHDALSAVFPGPGSPASRPAVSIAKAAPSNTAPAAPSPAAKAGKPAQAVKPIEPPKGTNYLGVKRCKKCHLQQWKSWQDTKMADALELLKPGVRGDEKAARNLNPQKDYSAETQCLACHATGFGHAGGYQTPASGDAAAARTAKEVAGVGCEACHGPGSMYLPVHQDVQTKRRQYAQSEFYKAGQYNVELRVCAGCHQEQAPCVGSGYVFDFEARKEQGTHRHFDLKLRGK